MQKFHEYTSHIQYSITAYNDWKIFSNAFISDKKIKSDENRLR